MGDIDRLEAEAMEAEVPVLQLDRYKDNVRKFRSKQQFFYDHTDIFWVWDKVESRYKQVDHTDILNLIQASLKLSGEIINKNTKSNYLEALRQVGRESKPKDAPKHWIQFKDTYFDIEKATIYKVSPEYFFCNPIPWPVGDSKKTPTIDRIFEEWVGKDYVQTLYEIIAYCTLTYYPMHRMFFLVGSGMNGKSKFLELVEIFLGRDNVSATEFDLLINSRFESTVLYKKLVVLMSETNYSVLKKTGFLKKLTGGDAIRFEFKNKQPFKEYSYAKLLIATNELPMTVDTTTGFYRRPVVIDFPNEFSEKKDILADIPEIEYKNLARKTLKNIQRLLKYRQFTNEGDIEERRKRYEERSNIFQQFINKCCTVGEDLEVSATELYSRFVRYCKKRKCRVPTQTRVGTILNDLGFERQRKTITKRDDDETTSKQITQYYGICLKDDEEQTEL